MRIGCGSLVYILFGSVLITLYIHSYFIKEGTVSESGTHDELIARRGDYYQYVQLQVLNY